MSNQTPAAKNVFWRGGGRSAPKYFLEGANYGGSGTHAMQWYEQLTHCTYVLRGALVGH